MEKKMVPLVLIDGHNLLFRAAYGFPTRIVSREGVDCTALFGFFAIARKAALELGEAEWVVCFDGIKGLASRLEEDANYKAQRVFEDLSLFEMIPHIKTGLEQVGIKWVELETCEADDVIATLVTYEQARGRDVYIMSTDKDFFQLVSENTFILNTVKKREQWVVKHEDILALYGVTPSQWCDFRALTGDPSDNIEGVAGMGPKTAAKLLADGVGLEVLEEMGRLQGKMGVKVLEAWERVLRNRRLIKMRYVAELELAGFTSDTHTEWPVAKDVMKALAFW